MENLYLRTKELAIFLIENNSTIRKTAKHFGMAKSTVHYDLSYRLPSIDYVLYRQVKKILDSNFAEKNIRGGMATKRMYSRKRTATKK